MATDSASGCEVKLSLIEKSWSVWEAAIRMIVSDASRLNHSSTYKRSFFDRLSQEVVGCIAERAWSKYRGQYHRSPINEFHDVADAPGGVEIRGVDQADKRLIVRANDPDDRVYVSVLVDSDGNATIRGWITGGGAKRDEYRDNPNGYRAAWFVPAADLRAVEEMP